MLSHKFHFLKVLFALFNLCKINKRRQEQAAENGIIPHLMHFIMSDSPLKQNALPLLCDMAHASRNSREQLRAHDGLDVYLSLLEDDVWSVTALDSIAVCLAHDNDNRKVEQALLKKDAIQKLVKFFQCCPEQHFVHILEPFLKIITYAIFHISQSFVLYLVTVFIKIAFSLFKILIVNGSLMHEMHTKNSLFNCLPVFLLMECILGQKINPIGSYRFFYIWVNISRVFSND